jgi:hypothetical protein
VEVEVQPEPRCAVGKMCRRPERQQTTKRERLPAVVAVAVAVVVRRKSCRLVDFRFVMVVG